MKRQGDLLIRKIEKLPEGLKIDPTNIIVFGEATGHAHRLNGGSVVKSKEGLIYLDIKNKAEISHEEHKTINLEAGKYAVVRQREYLMEDMERLVVD